MIKKSKTLVRDKPEQGQLKGEKSQMRKPILNS